MTLYMCLFFMLLQFFECGVADDARSIVIVEVPLLINKVPVMYWERVNSHRVVLAELDKVPTTPQHRMKFGQVMASEFFFSAPMKRQTAADE